ncbi:hypothetical protein EJ06DRAFT_557572 [Trichodelitschia bisporula]|uniref:Uncharacterized protein n=1 Tax=Trichodelitschia bisporula TaxID=703511 RepID=A0A6G1HTK0_9PEZI|nr:hypothetical protein EJ06DRAFT_557572 [Trichodelitschia bisporula]
MSFIVSHHKGEAHHEDEDLLQAAAKGGVDITTKKSAGKADKGNLPVKRVPQAPDRLTPHIPPENFGAVIPGAVYRSSFPTKDNFSFLKSLKLKTILTLVPEPYPDEYVEFLNKAGIVQIIVPVPANKETVQMDDATIIKALGVVMDKTKHPLLIHCNKGKHRTGCVVGCLRKFQGDSMENIISEYHTYADPKARLLDEHFMHKFNERPLLWLAREGGRISPEGFLTPMRGQSRTKA